MVSDGYWVVVGRQKSPEKRTGRVLPRVSCHQHVVESEEVVNKSKDGRRGKVWSPANSVILRGLYHSTLRGYLQRKAELLEFEG